MSVTMEDGIKRWTAKRKTALVWNCPFFDRTARHEDTRRGVLISGLA